MCIRDSLNIAYILAYVKLFVCYFQSLHKLLIFKDLRGPGRHKRLIISNLRKTIVVKAVVVNLLNVEGGILPGDTVGGFMPYGTIS